MRLKNKEKELIKDSFNSDLNIEIERSKYTAILVNDIHYSKGGKRKGVTNRGIKLYLENSQVAGGALAGFNGGRNTTWLFEPRDNRAFKNSKQAINWLKENGDLRNLVQTV